MTGIAGIELTKLLEIVKLINHARGILFEGNGRQFIQFVLYQPFPILVVICPDFPIRLGQFHKSLGEGIFPIGMAKQLQTAIRRVLNTGNASLGVNLRIHLILLPGRTETGAAGLILIAVKRVFRIITVADTDIAVGQPVFYGKQTFYIVFDVVQRVEDKADIELAFQISKHFFLVAHHDGNIPDTRFLQLLDLPLDQFFSIHFIQALWLFQRQGNKPCCRAGG